MKYLKMIFFTALCSFSITKTSANNIQKDTSIETKQYISDSNLSKRYGSWLFNGGFSQYSFSATNPDYQLTQGDKLLVQIWGGIDYQAETQVDPQGNIFIPKVGPIKVLGVTNNKLNEVILNSVKRVYKSNVEVYASLMSSQQVKVFLSGMVNKPGLYEGQSADSVLRFIDQAGGIRDDIGSYRNIQIKRKGLIKQQIDLYQFLQYGNMSPAQLQDGDVIFVGPKQGEVTLEGMIGFQGLYELNQENQLNSILTAVVTDEQATHITLIAPDTNSILNSSNNSNMPVDATQYTIKQAKNITVTPGTLIKVTAQLRPKSISIDLLGEHNSAQEMVLPWGSSLADLLDKIEFSRLSNTEAVQLYRKSVAKRQYDMLQASLTSLEQSVLTTRSETKEAAALRQAEASIILQWIEKARLVQPKGQVLLSKNSDLSKIILKQGDKVVIPAKRNLVIIHGEVLFPTAIAFNEAVSAKELIEQAGGANQDIDDMNILVMKPNGSFIKANDKLSNTEIISAGDEIFVLSKPDEKSWQFAADITQIIYQIAMAAAVVLSI